MARPAQTIEDRTPLDAPRIDIASRIGWLLRICRLERGISLGTMAERLSAAGSPMSAATLSQFENNGVRDGQTIDAYERVLELEVGRLRAGVDVLCRSFRYSPDDRRPGLPEPADLARFDAAVEPVLDGTPTGGQWLTFAREIDSGSRFGLTSRQMTPLVHQLAGELGRSVANAYTTRYEALARLRCGRYADLVEAVVREIVADPATQVLNDLMSAVSELPTVPVLTWAGELLGHESARVATAASYAVKNLRAVPGLAAADWPLVVEPFVRAHDRWADGDGARRHALAELFAYLPAPQRRQIAERVRRPVEPVARSAHWSSTRRRAHLALTREVSRGVCRRLGLPEQPMLGRLLFETMYDVRAPRAATSFFLLIASPLAPALLPPLVELTESSPDEATREGALWALTTLHPASPCVDVSRWLDGADTEQARVALLVTAHAGLPLPDSLLRRRVDDPGTRRQALYAAGMTSHPLLEPLASDPAQPDDVRRAARWWARQGGRVIA